MILIGVHPTKGYLFSPHLSAPWHFGIAGVIERISATRSNVGPLFCFQCTRDKAYHDRNENRTDFHDEIAAYTFTANHRRATVHSAPQLPSQAAPPQLPNHPHPRCHSPPVHLPRYSYWWHPSSIFWEHNSPRTQT